MQGQSRPSREPSRAKIHPPNHSSGISQGPEEPATRGTWLRVPSSSALREVGSPYSRTVRTSVSQRRTPSTFNPVKSGSAGFLKAEGARVEASISRLEANPLPTQPSKLLQRILFFKLSNSKKIRVSGGQCVPLPEGRGPPPLLQEPCTPSSNLTSNRQVCVDQTDTVQGTEYITQDDRAAGYRGREEAAVAAGWGSSAGLGGTRELWNPERILFP